MSRYSIKIRQKINNAQYMAAVGKLSGSSSELFAQEWGFIGTNKNIAPEEKTEHEIRENFDKAL